MDEAARALKSPNSPNKLLARLPGAEYRRLLPHLETIRLQHKRVLLRPNVPVHKVYFLGGGLCSITQGTVDGQMAGVAMVGSEGLLGTNAFGGDPESGQTAVVEIADCDAQVMDATIFRREMARQEAFSDLIERYTQAFIQGLMQSIACNALHAVERRCARCLLDIRDRVGGNECPVTQDLLAVMLGVRRASVTLAAGTLRRARLIDNAHKSIIISNAMGLEAAACECYGLIKRNFSRLLP